MAFVLSGASTARLVRSSGLVGNANSFQILLGFKRLSTQSNTRQVLTLRRYGGGDTGHDLITNNPSNSNTWTAFVAANFFASVSAGQDLLPVDIWVWLALSGDGTNLTIRTRQEGEEAWQGQTITQTTFVPTRLVIGDDESGTRNFHGKYAHLREWNDELSESELNAEIASDSAVRTSGLVSAKSGLAVDLTTALTGESGSAFTAGAGVTLDTDEPSFAAPSANPLISGSALLPASGEGVETQLDVRYNRLLYSSDLSNAVWAKLGHVIETNAAPGPPGRPALARMTNNHVGGGVYQFATAPNGPVTVSCDARPGSANWLAMRLLTSDFAQGTWVFFNLLAGTIGAVFDFGGMTGGGASIVAAGGGIFRCSVTNSSAGARGVEFYAAQADASYSPQSGLSVLLGNLQLEDGALATHYKPSTSAVITRALDSISVGAAATTIGVDEVTSATVRLLDDTGAPWDQYGPISVESDDPTVVGIEIASARTDAAGIAAISIIGLDEGTADLVASAGAATSSPVTITVDSTGTVRYVDVLMEPEWVGTAGWTVGIWAAPTSTEFPTGAVLYQATNQRFETVPVLEQAYMHIPLPSSVSLSPGDPVVVAFARAAEYSGFNVAEVV